MEDVFGDDLYLPGDWKNGGGDPNWMEFSTMSLALANLWHCCNTESWLEGVSIAAGIRWLLRDLKDQIYTPANTETLSKITGLPLHIYLGP